MAERKLPGKDVVARILQGEEWIDISVPVAQKEYKLVRRAEIWCEGKCVVALECDPLESKVERDRRNNKDVAYLKLRLLNLHTESIKFVAALTADKYFDDLDIGDDENDIVNNDGEIAKGKDKGKRLKLSDLKSVLPVIVKPRGQSWLEKTFNFENKSDNMSFDIDVPVKADCTQNIFAGEDQENEFVYSPVVNITRNIDLKNSQLVLPGFEVLIDSRRNVGCTVRHSLAWLRGDNVSKYSVEFKINTERFAQMWNGFPATRYLSGIRMIKAGSALSFMPLIKPESVGIINDGKKEIDEAEWLLLYLYDGKTIKATELQPLERLQASLKFDCVKSHSSASISYAVALFNQQGLKSGREMEECRQREENWRTTETPPRIWFALNPTDFAALTNSVCRIGALDLQLAPKFKQDPEAISFIKVRLQERLPRIELNLSLPLRDFLPSGQDDVPGARLFGKQFSAMNLLREQPIITLVDDEFGNLVVERKDDEEVTDRFLLEIKEQNADSLDQNIDLKIRDIRLIDASKKEHEAEPRNVVVIDRQPFFVGLVQFKDFYGNDLQGLTTELGNWNSESPAGAAWELHAGAKEFTLVMPPQIIGEAAEKFGPEKSEKDVGEKEAVDYRFSNLFKATLLPTYFRQRYVEPAWNSRRIFGYAGQRAPGAAVTAMSFELLYGLGCTVLAPEMRLAELMARVGQLRMPPLDRIEPGYTGEQIARFEKHKAKNWNHYYAALHRLAVLQPAHDDSLEQQHIETGLEFKLRDKADLKYPIPEKKPRNSSIPSNPKGLTGSYSWAFDSQNDYEELWANPKSKIGELNGLAFSSLGGWGGQRAVFANGKLTLTSSSSMGRTHTFTKERKGRIGCFWNKAKHVVVFERTVKRAAQFPKQDPLLGRPVIRKVREYIELLEPVRKYPDNSGTNLARGCILGIDFRSKIINVDGDWSQDVGEIGYQIPLWKKDLAMDSVYPKPSVFLEVATDPDSGSGSDLRAMEDPSNVYFYASTVEQTDDTNQWAAVIGVDYSPCAPQASSPIEHLGELHVAPGFGRFTFAVERSEKPANFVVDRTDKKLGAVIKNVSMVRHIFEPEAGKTLTLGKLFEASDHLSNSIGLLTTAAQDVVSEKEIRERLSKGIVELENNVLQHYDDALQHIADKVDDAEKMKEKAVSKVSAFFASKIEIADKEYQHLVSEYLHVVEQAKHLVDELDEFTNGKKQNLKDGINEAAKTAKSAVVSCEASVYSVIDKIVALEKYLQESKLQKLYEETRDFPIPKTDQELRNLRAKFTEILGEIEGFINSVARLTETAFSGWLFSSVSSLTKDLNNSIRSLRTSLSVLSAKLENLAVDAQNDIKDIRDKAAAEVKKVLDVVVTTRQEIDKVLVQLRATTKTEADAISSFIDEKVKKINEIIDKAADLDELKKKCSEFFDQIGSASVLLEFEECLKKYAGAIEKTVTSKIAELIPSVGDLIGGIKKDQFNAIKDAISANAPSALIKSLSESVGKDLENSLSSLQHRVLPTLNAELSRELPKDLGMKLVRILGDVPKVPSLDFRYQMDNLPPAIAPIAYLFDPAKLEIDTTAVKAIVDHAENTVRDALKPLALSLPTNKMLDQFLPNVEEMAGNLASDVLKDLSALPFDKLFPSLKIPEPLADHVIVTHQIDKQALRATVLAKVAFDSSEPATLFTLGPVSMIVSKTAIAASIEIQAEASGSTSRKSSGKVSGNWRLNVGGTDFVTFEDTALTFDERGSLHFDVSPSKIRYAGALQFLSDLLARSGLSDSGSGIKLIPAPLKVICTLDLPIPNLQLPGFALTNLRLGTSLWLALKDKSIAIGVAMNLATKLAPFSITICLLGGGGWLEFSCEYVIGKGISTDLSIGITAGASFGIDLSVVSGGVFVMFGLTVEYHTAGNAGLTIGIMLLLSGHVSVMGIIDADLTLLLEAKYGSDKSVTAHGVLSIKIKICWCFTLKVHKEITYVLKKGDPKHSAANEDDHYANASNSYINSMA